MSVRLARDFVERAFDLLPRALADLGVPSRAASERLDRAWTVVDDPAWARKTSIQRIAGGVLEIGVASAALRSELSTWHAPRLLGALREALPEMPLVGLRFIVAEETA